MKKFLAVLLATVLVLTCLVAVACENNQTVVVYLHHYNNLDETVTKLYDPGTPLPTPKRDNYTFAGWYTADGNNGEPFVDGTEMKSNFHLYARWTPSSATKYTVTFVYNDGATSNSTVSVNANSPVTLPTPSRTNYRFDGWYTAQTGGTQWKNTDPVTSDITLYARWTAKGSSDTEHTQHNFGDSYFAYVKCSVDGCDVYGRNSGTRQYDNKCDFSDAKKTEIEQHLAACDTENIEDVETFYAAFSIFESDLEYLDSQYTWAMVYYDSGSFGDSDYNAIKDCYDEMFVEYCKLIVAADTKYSSSFWDLYTEDKNETLAMAQMYANTPDSSEVNEILSEYDEAMNSYSPDTTTINNLYKRLVEAYNTEATSYGKQNYMEYAYAEIYNREYGEEQIKIMRQYIKDSIVPLFLKVATEYENLLAYDQDYQQYYIDFSDEENESFYYGLTSDSIFETESYEYFDEVRDTVNFIASYFGWLDNANAKYTFTNAVNDMFRYGKYFSGEGEGAYTTWVSKDNTPVCYFQQGDAYYSGYDTAFTFVHEFGHYYENIHNGNLTLSYDHDETQSQGNEMLFLAWLGDNDGVKQSYTEGYNAVKLEQLYNILDSIITSAAVDELEWSAYKNEVTDGDYNAKFETILKSYVGDENIELMDTSYWMYVAFDSAAYYVSYAISALPAVEIYAIAEEKSLEDARTAYLNLFAYCEDDSRMDSYTYTGDDGVLEFCGLGNPFTENIYTNIKKLESFL